MIILMSTLIYFSINASDFDKEPEDIDIHAPEITLSTSR